MIRVNKAPFPWFGGKSKAAPAVWDLLGDVAHYVEPFAGALGVLLERPHPCNRAYYSETVNDLDGLLVNAWRSIQLSPDETAEACSWPVSELDVTARHIALVNWREQGHAERLACDPLWHDPTMAGWWLYGICAWIGGGWCSGDGPWHADPDTGRIVKQGRGTREPGVKNQRPHLSNAGMGVHRPQLWEPGVGEFHPIVMPELRRWFAWLSARLRHVRIVNGDWRRVVTSGAAKTLPVKQGKSPAGIFLDPPYADTAKRKKGLYAQESLDVAHDVREWALEHGDDPQLRIVMAGFDGEHGDAFESAGWRAVEWFASGFLTGGYGAQSDAGHQQARERLWASPHCLAPAEDPQLSLYD